ncbi:MAG TPA: spore germination protein GerW family protein [Dehalococcoidia bacterium]|nr:spore germination protein GerW family protein [Dehalococcoidia bacterium]
MEQPALTGERIVSDLLDRIRGSARVEVVYGEAKEIGDKTIIPVAVVAYGFGAGAGGGTSPIGEGSGGGGGGGGVVRVQPVGVLEVTQDDTRLVPVLDWTRIVTTAITFLGLWLVVRGLRGRRR